MSVLINGMKMPKGCYDCPLFDNDMGECQFLHEEPYGLSGMNVRLSDCPLIGDSDNDDSAERSCADEEVKWWNVARIKWLLENERSEDE